MRAWTVESIGTCTLAIINLSFFDASEFPSIEPWRLFPRSDVSSYGQILEAVSKVADHCISLFTPAAALLAADDDDDKSGAPVTRLGFVSETGWHAVGESMQSLLNSSASSDYGASMWLMSPDF